MGISQMGKKYNTLLSEWSHWRWMNQDRSSHRTHRGRAEVSEQSDEVQPNGIGEESDSESDMIMIVEIDIV